MKLRLANILWLIAALIAAGCSSDSGWQVKCTLDGLGQRGVELVYATPRGLVRLQGHAEGGVVTFKGHSAEPALAELFTLGGERLMSLVVADGDRIEAEMKIGEPGSLRLKGTASAEMYGRWLADNDSLLSQGSDADINRSVARMVEEHPGQAASALVLMTHFTIRGNELQADSLYNRLEAAARPASLTRAWVSRLSEQLAMAADGEMRTITLTASTDSTRKALLAPSFQSYGLLVVTDAAKPDSVKRALRALGEKLDTRRLNILEAGVQPDSAVWRADIASDTATWQQGWAPGGVAGGQLRRLVIPATPYYIVTDSTGTQLYRGESVADALALLRSHGISAEQMTAHQPDTIAPADSVPDVPELHRTMLRSRKSNKKLKTADN